MSAVENCPICHEPLRNSSFNLNEALCDSKNHIFEKYLAGADYYFIIRIGDIQYYSGRNPLQSKYANLFRLFLWKTTKIIYEENEFYAEERVPEILAMIKRYQNLVVLL